MSTVLEEGSSVYYRIKFVYAFYTLQTTRKILEAGVNETREGAGENPDKN